MQFGAAARVCSLRLHRPPGFSVTLGKPHNQVCLCLLSPKEVYWLEEEEEEEEGAVSLVPADDAMLCVSEVLDLVAFSRSLEKMLANIRVYERTHEDRAY